MVDLVVVKGVIYHIQYYTLMFTLGDNDIAPVPSTRVYLSFSCIMSYHYMNFILIFIISIFKLIIISYAILIYWYGYWCWSYIFCGMIWPSFDMIYCLFWYFFYLLSHIISELASIMIMYVCKFPVFDQFEYMALCFRLLFIMAICLHFLVSLFLIIVIWGEDIEILSIFTRNKCLMQREHEFSSLKVYTIIMLCWLIISGSWIFQFYFKFK